MNKKRIFGIGVATVAFSLICGFSMLFHSLFDGNVGVALNQMISYAWSEYYSGLYLDSSYYEGEEDTYYDDSYNDYNQYYDEYTDMPVVDYIGVVMVDGTIIDSGEMEYYGYEMGYYDHQGTLDYIDILMESTENHGILLYVDSPGGGVYESDELYLKLMEYKEKTKRPIWTYMASQACSGGLYVSMASDKIYCNRNGLTGSIGVVLTLEDYTEYISDMGIKEINITSGRNKTMGSGGEKLTDEQRAIFQSIVDESYDQFVDVVATGRNITTAEVKAFADGRVYTPKQALSLRLIDGIATYEEVEALFNAELGNEMLVYEPQSHKTSYLTSSEKAEDKSSKSDFETYIEFKNRQGSGVPMYYAKPAS